MSSKNAYAAKQIQSRKLMMDAQRLFTIQYCSDLMAIMLHREFGFGAERCNRALQAFGRLHDEFMLDALEDDQNDRNLNFTKGNLDNLLREIFKDKTQSFEQRYDFLPSVIKKGFVKK